jgi:lysyl-tRNA synthetase class 2
MKRLLAAGATAIYQITRAFRREEVGPLHNPEFTMLEWYRVGDTHREQMAFTERLVRHVMSKAEGGKRKAERGSPDCVDQTSTINPLTPSLHSPTSDLRPPPSAFRLPPSAFRRLTYDEAFERYLGIRVLGLSAAELRELAISRGIGFPASLTADDRDEWLNLLLVECVEPELRAAGPTFLYDFPASQAALAVVRDEQPAALDGCAAAAPSRAAVAERFELYVGGVELCNGYHELTDADELRRRIAAQSAIRARNNRRALPADSRLLDAMQHGLPPCSGVALGLDRLALLALGGQTLADVTAFPIDRA